MAFSLLRTHSLETLHNETVFMYLQSGTRLEEIMVVFRLNQLCSMQAIVSCHSLT